MTLTLTVFEIFRSLLQELYPIHTSKNMLSYIKLYRKCSTFSVNGVQSTPVLHSLHYNGHPLLQTGVQV